MPGAAPGGARGLEFGRVLHYGRGVRRGHLGHVPYLLQKRWKLPVLQLQGDAHIRVLHAQGPKFREDGQDLTEEYWAARRRALLVEDVHPQSVQVISLDLFY